MTDDEPEIDIPDSWKANIYEFTGNFKLVAEFKHEETGACVRVTPYKTYGQPGFCNAHRLVLVHPEDGVEEIVVGMEVEHVEDAEETAIKKMREYSG
ncbi:hypothetical protein [Halorubrum sp. FL23]|uniref:hypothetical protein n=1 Tax=Halorubrum sp. FL23 TaxID=3458704 RepID=UPI0040339056